MPSLSIDGKEIFAEEGDKILWTALKAGIYIPHLCAEAEAELPFGGCRLCFVEIELNGRSKMVTSCSEPVLDGMKVFTNTKKVIRIRKMAFNLIISDHHLNCKPCAKKKGCELIKIASKLKIPLKTTSMKSLARDLPVDDSHPLFTFDPRKCIKCGKCIFTCQRLGNSFLDFANRGFEMIVTSFDRMPLSSLGCDSCLKCVNVCPTGSLFLKEKGNKENG